MDTEQKLDKVCRWAKAEKEKIDQDEHFSTAPAQVQIAMNTRRQCLKEVLEMLEGHKEKPAEVNLQTSVEAQEKISKIVQRAVQILRDGGTSADGLSLFMDLAACHLNGCELDLDKLAAFDDFNLMHDVGGIASHINRETGKIERGFLPRCAVTS